VDETGRGRIPLDGFPEKNPGRASPAFDRKIEKVQGAN
jgi:hypothetical protein